MRDRRKHYSRHHRICRSWKENWKITEESILIIDSKKHKSWHILFQNYKPEQIAQIINTQFLDPRFEFIVVKKS